MQSDCKGNHLLAIISSNFGCAQYSAGQDAEQIVVLEKGVVAERGSHEAAPPFWDASRGNGLICLRSFAAGLNVIFCLVYFVRRRIPLFLLQALGF